MIITGARDLFLRGIQAVQNIAGESTMLPILSNVVIEATNGGIQFLATDLKTSITYYLPIEVNGQGAISLPAKKLSEIIRELPDNTLELEIEEGHRARIHCGKVRYQILGFSKDDFPKLPTLTEGESLTLPSELLRKLIGGVLYAAAQDDTRYILNGCRLSVSPEMVQLVATDGHRLAFGRVEGREGSSWQAIIPSKTLSELVRILPQDEEPVKVKCGENKIEFHAKHLKVVASLIQGQFPNVEDVLKRSHQHAVQIDTQVLLKAVRRVSLVVVDKSNAIRLEIQPGQILLHAQTTELGEAKEELDVQYDGPPTTILLNYKYFLEALKAVGVKQTTLTFNGGASAIGLIATGETRGTHIIMPIRPT